MFQSELKDLPRPRQLFLITPQNFVHSANNYKAKIKCVICGQSHSHKGCPNGEKSNQSVLTVKDHMLLTIKGVPLIKKQQQVFRQHVVDNQKSYASILKQNSAPPPQPKSDTFSFYSQPLYKICSHCGHPNRSATCVLLKCPKRCSLQVLRFWFIYIA